MSNARNAARSAATKSGLGSRLGARVVSADGTVRTLPDDFHPNTLRAMLTANFSGASRGTGQKK